MGEMDLDDVVLSWSVPEITDDDLYRDKVRASSDQPHLVSLLPCRRRRFRMTTTARAAAPTPSRA
jgi:hypothetical protein